ncbi:NAD(P)/FAD-dependent oxidoreductase [Microbacterium sp. X-17]|uniref:NAD(P)/FAD-dependent oxidoreductase n=1 Tax=Microbacterium sp. X-17 TaxID=3144404 RepID=UPI0031F508CD
MPKKAVVIGAGPAGLTAAYEFLNRTEGDDRVVPEVFEGSGDIGGISKTVSFKGNRIDIGGHRFFSKSDVVMKWWLDILPPEKTAAETFTLKYRGQTRDFDGTEYGVDPETTDDVMLVRSRLSRIYYLRSFFNYPITLEWSTLKNLGFLRLVRIGFSYIKARLFPLKEVSLEEFYVNRFGRELYNTFFKSYTEKVWGVPVTEIEPDWGAQRVKGLSISKTIAHAFKKAFGRSKPKDIAQKDTETSLIESFLYPKLGPGYLWEVVARRVQERGGTVEMEQMVVALHAEGNRIVAADVRDSATGAVKRVEGDYFISTMPVKDLVAAIRGIDVPKNVEDVAAALPYRDFITVGLVLKKLALAGAVDRDGTPGRVPDNWIYIQEPDVQVGRLQVFNNWSPYMVSDPDTVWVGMEYFVDEGDELWSMADEDMVAFGVKELAKIGIIDAADFIEGTVLRVQKTYPAYFGAYRRFDEVREFVDGFENLFLVGRNGMHRYNNQDHSMLTAIEAVDNVIAGRVDKSNIWDVNVEQEYHEEKSSS